MEKKIRLEIVVIAIFMIVLGWQAIVSDVILPYRGRNIPAISFPFDEPYVPLLGRLLIVGGLYILYRVVATMRKK